MANTTSGEKAKARIESADMEENSPASAQNGKRSTRKTVKLTREETLEILSQSFRYCEEAGIDLDVSADIGTVIVTIHGANFIDGVLVPISEASQ
jgi:ribosome-associated protein YbcJ (S4-like RNA binding protein)